MKKSLFITLTTLIALIVMLTLIHRLYQPQNTSIEHGIHSDTIGYCAARDMKGLASFKIGESTISEVIEEIKKEIREDSRAASPKYNMYSDKYLESKYDSKGKFIGTYYREDFSYYLHVVTYDTISSFLNEDKLGRKFFGCPQNTDIEMSRYYIGDIEAGSLKLKFYRDTLFEIECHQNDRLVEGFNAKYGIGKTTEDIVKTFFKSNILKYYKRITWENENVKTESLSHAEWKGDGGKISYINSYFKITTKNKNLTDEINDCGRRANEIRKRLNESKIKSDLDKL